MPNRSLLVDDIRVRATAKTGIEPKIPLKKTRNADNLNIQVTCVISINIDVFQNLFLATLFKIL